MRMKNWLDERVYGQVHVKQTSHLTDHQKTVHQVYLIIPDWLWEIQADSGLIAGLVEIRFAPTPNEDEACKPGPSSISPGCITHF